MVCVMCHVVARVGEHCCRGLRDLLFSSASFETDWHSPATAKVTFFAQSAKKVSGIYHSSTRHSFFVVNICTLSISAAPTFCWMFPQLLLGGGLDAEQGCVLSISFWGSPYIYSL